MNVNTTVKVSDTSEKTTMIGRTGIIIRDMKEIGVEVLLMPVGTKRGLSWIFDRAELTVIG